MKKFLITRLFCLTLALAGSISYPAHKAQAGGIEIDIAKQLIGMLSRKAVDSFFGAMSEDQSLTVEQLGEVLDNEFTAYELNEIADLVSALRFNVAVYNPKATVETRKAHVERVKQDADKALNFINLKLANTDMFWKLMPAYKFVKNVQLSFLAEYYALTNAHSVKSLIAEAAANGIGDVERYFTNYFKDTKQFNCLHWPQNFPIYILNGSLYNPAHNPHHNEKNTFCGSWFKEYNVMDQMKLPAMILWRPNWIVERENHNGQFYFTYRKKGTTDYWIANARSKDEATSIRLARSIDSYPEKIGMTSTYLSDWYKIVSALSTNNTEKNAANANMQKLGILH